MSQNYPEAFKLYRRQKTMAMSGRQLREFKHDFPRYELYWLGSCALDLVKMSETRVLLGSDFRISAYQALKKALEHKRPSTEKGLWVTARKLQFDKPGDDRLRRISLVVEDESGTLEEERENFLDSLSSLTGVRLPPAVFVPKIELGKAPVDASLETLHFLAPFTRSEIKLTPLRMRPSLENLQNSPT